MGPPTGSLPAGPPVLSPNCDPRHSRIPAPAATAVKVTATAPTTPPIPGIRPEGTNPVGAGCGVTAGRVGTEDVEEANWENGCGGAVGTTRSSRSGSNRQPASTAASTAVPA